MAHKNKVKGTKFELECAEFIGGWRYPADTGGPVDVESELCVGQSRKRKGMSHPTLSQLATKIETIGFERRKLGVVLHQVPPGRGKQSVKMITMTWNTFDEWFCLRKNPAWFSSHEQDEESDGA